MVVVLAGVAIANVLPTLLLAFLVVQRGLLEEMNLSSHPGGHQLFNDPGGG